MAMRRKPARASKRYVRKGVRRIRKPISSVHRFKEMFKFADIGAGPGAFASGVLAPAGISQLTNSASFINMFDLYKITGIKYKIVPRFNSSEVGAYSTTSLPQLYLATNRDPFCPPAATVGDILNDDTCKVHSLSRPISWYVKAPKPDMSVAITIAEQQYVAPQNWQLGVSTKYQPWLTTGGGNQSLDQSALKHYGLRWALDNYNPFSVSVDVYATLYFQCKEQN